MLGDYAAAKRAVQWLEKHFRLQLQHKRIDSATDAVQGTVCASNRSLSRYCCCLAAHHTHKTSVEIEARQHFKKEAEEMQKLFQESLAVGLKFLDTNCSGTLP